MINAFVSAPMLLMSIISTFEDELMDTAVSIGKTTSEVSFFVSVLVASNNLLIPRNSCVFSCVQFKISSPEFKRQL